MPATVSHIKTSPIADYAGVVTVGNSSGGTVTMNASQLVLPSDWNSVHSVQITLTGSEIGSLFAAGAGLNVSTNSSGVTYAIDEEEFFEPYPWYSAASTAHTLGVGTWFFSPFALHFPIESGIIRMPVTNAGGLLNNLSVRAAVTSDYAVCAQSAGYTHNIAIYTQGNGSDITRIGTFYTGQITFGVSEIKSVGSVASASTQVQVSRYATVTIPGQWDASAGVVYSTVTVSGTLSAAASSILSSSLDSLISSANAYFSGSRMDIIPFTSTLAAGNYVFAHQWLTASGSSTSVFSTYTAAANYNGGTLIPAHVFPSILEVNIGGYKQLGKSVSNASSIGIPWQGWHNTSQSTAYSTLATANLSATNIKQYWNFSEGALT